MKPVPAANSRWNIQMPKGKKNMRPTILISSLAVTATLALSPANAQSAGYSAGDLLSPCQEADNDARWGEAAETECEQYILGFVGALNATGAAEANGICPPAVNMADEIRWAFMRWVHSSYTAHKAMPADEAMLATLKESFACE